MQQIAREDAENHIKYAKDLLSMLNSDHFKEFLKSLLNYFKVTYYNIKELFAVEDKLKVLFEEAKGTEINVLPYERTKLIGLARQVAINYSWILVCFIQQRSSNKDTEYLGDSD